MSNGDKHAFDGYCDRCHSLSNLDMQQEHHAVLDDLRRLQLLVAAPHPTLDGASTREAIRSELIRMLAEENRQLKADLKRSVDEDGWKRTAVQLTEENRQLREEGSKMSAHITELELRIERIKHALTRDPVTGE